MPVCRSTPATSVRTARRKRVQASLDGVVFDDILPEDQDPVEVVLRELEA